MNINWIKIITIVRWTIIHCMHILYHIISLIRRNYSLFVLSLYLIVFPFGWNTSTDNSYNFYYELKSNSQVQGLFKAICTQQNIYIHFMAWNDYNQTTTASTTSPSSTSSSRITSQLELNVNDYLNIDKELTSNTHIDFNEYTKDLKGLFTLYSTRILQSYSSLVPSTSSSTTTSSSITGSASSTAPTYSPTPMPGIPPTLIDDEDMVYYQQHPFPRRPRGDFQGDLDPFSTGQPGGNLMGPSHFRPSGYAPPGQMPRYDPIGPHPGMGEPDFDELPPPGPAGPLQAGRGRLGGPSFGTGRSDRGQFGTGHNGFGVDPRGFGPGGFPGGGFT